MRARRPRALWAWLLAAVMLLPAWLHAEAAVPKLVRHVTDLTGTLSAQQVDQLDAQLVALEKAKGAQLVVLMVGSTKPQDIDSYSIDVAMANKVGRKGVDDGVLLLVAKDDHA
ncbi:MAG: TPM domain-containing protein, partial [Xanthomonadaceae bacterium]|nr:TPM domain-containing protein [Xanthomonadaceae bacterium]